MTTNPNEAEGWRRCSNALARYGRPHRIPRLGALTDSRRAEFPGTSAPGPDHRGRPVCWRRLRSTRWGYDDKTMSRTCSS